MSENAVNVAGSKLANEVKKSKKTGSAADPGVQDARRVLAAAKLANYIERIVAAAPPLTESQKQQISALLWSRP